VKARLEAALRRLGTAGVLGIGLLLACAGFYVSALAPLEQEAAAQRLALERLKARTPHRPVSSGGREEDLRRFQALFPSASELTDEVERLHRLARRAGLDLAQGEYRLERRVTGLWAYRVTLPVRGTYPQFRDFLGAVLKDMPIASIDALRFERKRAAETQLEAQVRVTLYARPPGEAP
jgi:Tfp pilus assembly protein PilO